jgi:hypothetical protein
MFVRFALNSFEKWQAAIQRFSKGFLKVWEICKITGRKRLKFETE